MVNVNAFKKKIIGKPCEGKLHARFDEGGAENRTKTSLRQPSTLQL